MIYFNSDYLEGAHPALMAKAQSETNMVQDRMATARDEYCAAARVKIQNACQAMPDRPTSWWAAPRPHHRHRRVTNRGRGRAMHGGHISCHRPVTIRVHRPKVSPCPPPTARSRPSRCESMWSGTETTSPRNIVQPGMVYISYPTEEAPLLKAELTERFDVCRRYGLPLFIDGAR